MLEREEKRRRLWWGHRVGGTLASGFCEHSVSFQPDTTGSSSLSFYTAISLQHISLCIFSILYLLYYSRVWYRVIFSLCLGTFGPLLTRTYAIYTSACLTVLKIYFVGTLFYFFLLYWFGAGDTKNMVNLGDVWCTVISNINFCGDEIKTEICWGRKITLVEEMKKKYSKFLVIFLQLIYMFVV